MFLLYIKAFHIISVIAWMAGILYLPRLFVYHTEAEIGSKQSETFKIMERRLLKAITIPAMIASWIFGLILAYYLVNWSAAGWFHVKLLLVIAMSAFTGVLGVWTRAFAEDRNTHTQRFYRFVNEVPTLLMIAIVILAVVRPF
ncbi:MAG: protoporphyrinogen oxidase HemJ [Methyloceanibacter sp.]|nr:protoporphyrinogen oxidase HemJ [Methyloceanibacter sp.]